MKLIVCPKCSYVFGLKQEPLFCLCGKSGGEYIDNLNAVIWGDAIPLGFANWSFIAALREQPESGMGKNFEAFVIPKVCPTVKRVDAPENIRHK